MEPIAQKTIFVVDRKKVFFYSVVTHDGKEKARRIAEMCGMLGANSEDEAYGQVMKAALTWFPRADGWTDHSPQVVDIDGYSIVGPIDMTTVRKLV